MIDNIEYRKDPEATQNVKKPSSDIKHFPSTILSENHNV